MKSSGKYDQVQLSSATQSFDDLNMCSLPHDCRISMWRWQWLKNLKLGLENLAPSAQEEATGMADVAGFIC